MLREEAEQRVGGEAKLASCLQRGAAFAKVNKGVEMIYFPQVKFGKKEAFQTQQTMSKCKQTSTGAFTAASELMGNLGWGFKSKDEDLQADSCTNTA